jgi:hypothetical protein
MNTTALTRNERGRITGITARILDQGKLADAIADELVRVGETSVDRAKIEPMDAVVLEGRAGGSFAVVNDEGVGGYETNDHVRVWFYYGVNGLYIHDTMVPSSDVLDAVTTDEVDLAEFIRTFGDRLDTNHSIWASWHFDN